MNNDNLVYSCSNFSITIHDATSEMDEDPIISNQIFEIPSPGIYTLEGLNRSGKSVLIKYIMGALPSGIIDKNKATAFINGINENIKIKNVSDALKSGLVAVFQDDELIPTMTVKEQLLLRHYKFPSIINWISNLLYNLVQHLKLYLSLQTMIEIPWINNKTSILEPAKEKAFPEIKVVKNITKWFDYFGLDKENLKKYPRQLSGGTKEKVRIINALLTPNIKILFLDEALSYIDGEEKAQYIEKLKSWRSSENATIVVVSHDDEEKLRWQPKERYFIDKEKHSITAIDYQDYSGLESGIVIKNLFYPKFTTLQSSKRFLNNCEKPILILGENEILNYEFVKNFFTQSDYKVEFISFDINERKKNLTEYNKAINIVAERLPKAYGTLIIIGGGVMLNFGSFIASTIHRGLVPHVLIPTTIMSIADVAVGSKSSININEGDLFLSRKHVVGTYTNPKAIIMDQRFLESLSIKEKKNGLSECFKQGLLQNKSLFDSTSNLLQMNNPSNRDCYQIALTTQTLKGETLVKDPFEQNYSKILLYGHLHAHCLERYMNFNIPHGLCVYWGILLDLYLAGNQELFNIVYEIILSSDIGKELKNIVEILSGENNFEKLKQIYSTDTKLQHVPSLDEFNVICVDHIGCYNDYKNDIKVIRVSWGDICNAINCIANYIRSSK